jgi:hypothetical protein
MGILREDLDDHEGYAMRRRPDGTLTTVWSAAIRAFTVYVAGCECGWQGLRHHPPTPAGEAAAEADWDQHADQMLTERGDRRRRELAQVLRALGGIAEVVDNPRNLPRIARAAQRAHQLAQDLERDTARPGPQREAGDAR